MHFCHIAWLIKLTVDVCEACSVSRPVDNEQDGLESVMKRVFHVPNKHGEFLRKLSLPEQTVCLVAESTCLF